MAERFRNAGLTINVQNSSFCQQKIKYLGYIVSEDGLSVDAEKIKPVID